MVRPWFIAVKKFGPADGEAWTKYVQSSGLTQVEELISLDFWLCQHVLNEIKDAYWPHIVNEDYSLNFFLDLDFLMRELAGTSGWRLLAAYRNPAEHPALPEDLSQFRFVGYDIADRLGRESVLANVDCPELDKTELSANGLLSTHQRALELQEALQREQLNDDPSYCDVWAIFAGPEG